MTTNGQRRPPRPRIEIEASNATPEEAAVIAAALERFLAETASPWQRAALIEGVSARRVVFPVEPGSGFPVS